MYRSNRSFNIPPPPGIPRAFDTFAVPGRREFDYQSLPGGTRLLFVVNTLTVLLSFCYIESELFSCIYKDFVRQLKAFLPSFCHLRACEMNHLNGSLCGAFERHFGSGRGEF